MSKADEMFNKLNYKSIRNKAMVWFQKRLNVSTVKDIVFLLQSKKVYVETSYYDKKGTLKKVEGIIEIEELQAINEKVKELGWI